MEQIELPKRPGPPHPLIGTRGLLLIRISPNAEAHTTGQWQQRETSITAEPANNTTILRSPHHPHNTWYSDRWGVSPSPPQTAGIYDGMTTNSMVLARLACRPTGRVDALPSAAEVPFFSFSFSLGFICICGACQCFVRGTVVLGS